MIPIIMIGLLFAVGCNNIQKRAPNDTPVTNDARVLYAGTLNVLTDLRRAGFIDDSEKAQIEELRKKTADALNAMESVELTTDSNLLDLRSKEFRALLDKLIDWRLKLQKKQTFRRAA